MLAKDIYGIGFATADQIAQKVGIPKDSLNRATAGIDHVLFEATSDGTLRVAFGKDQARGGEAAGSAGSNCRASRLANAHEWLADTGRDRRRAPDLPAASPEGGGRHSGKDQAAGGNSDGLPADRF